MAGRIFGGDLPRHSADSQKPRGVSGEGITDNAITFADDKANRDWTVEYYLENTKFRLERAISYADHHKNLKLTGELMRFLRLKGTLGAELTRYEWESAHYVLRALFKVIAPDTELIATPPTPSQPKDPDALLLG